jgi:hypothetical protein
MEEKDVNHMHLNLCQSNLGDMDQPCLMEEKDVNHIPLHLNLCQSNMGDMDQLSNQSRI